MHSLTYLTLDKDVWQLRQADVDAFALQTSGGALSAADEGYNDARQVWNAAGPFPRRSLPLGGTGAQRRGGCR
jgi:hypothetical protein